MKPIGTVHSPFASAAQIPTGQGACRERSRLHVHGLDMLDGTPILDLKPCLSSVPADESKRGWMHEAERGASSGGTP